MADTGAHNRDSDWAVQAMGPALQANHDDLVGDELGSHMTLKQMYKNSQSKSDRAALKEEEDAAKEDADSMKDKMRSKPKQSSFWEDDNVKWVLAGAALLFFMRR